MKYEPVIGLEVHAELQTQSKMFCACPVVDLTEAPPNVAVCPVCTGMPGVLPVVNQRAITYALRVALALNCEINTTSIFARKNYFYPDLPKGYQISQYEQPLARDGHLVINTPAGEKVIRIRRVHIEEDTGKLTHIHQESESYSLVDLNRAGVPLLEIVTEPDLHSVQAVRAFAVALRTLLRYLEVTSGDMEKGTIRVEPNVSVRPANSQVFGTRVEIKNLNSFRAIERAVDYEIKRQIEILRHGGQVVQETVGWDAEQEVTFTQRVKEEEDDYRYFPEPDLPPLVVDSEWIQTVRASLPELPHDKLKRFQEQYGLSLYDTDVLVSDRAVADFFERVVMAAPDIQPKMVANWVTGELFGLMNQAGVGIAELQIGPAELARLIQMVNQEDITAQTGKAVLGEMFATGESPDAIVASRDLGQISDPRAIAKLVASVLSENPQQVETYRSGKTAVERWFFGQVMQAVGGRANPQVVEQELEKQLVALGQTDQGEQDKRHLDD